jgi:hypothetical protein
VCAEVKAAGAIWSVDHGESGDDGGGRCRRSSSSNEIATMYGEWKGCRCRCRCYLMGPEGKVGRGRQDGVVIRGRETGMMSRQKLRNYAGAVLVVELAGGRCSVLLAGTTGSGAVAACGDLSVFNVLINAAWREQW